VKKPPFLVNALYYSTYLLVEFTLVRVVLAVVGAMKTVQLTGVIRLLTTCLEAGQLPYFHWQPGAAEIKAGSGDQAKH
jgi:hypothetical protein